MIGLAFSLLWDSLPYCLGVSVLVIVVCSRQVTQRLHKARKAILETWRCGKAGFCQKTSCARVSTVNSVCVKVVFANLLGGCFF